MEINVSHLKYHFKSQFSVIMKRLNIKRLYEDRDIWLT